MDFLNYLLSYGGGFGGGFGGYSPSGFGIHPLDALAHSLRTGGLDLHSWLSSLGGGGNPMPANANPMPALAGSPAGSTLLYPGGTPETAPLASPSTYSAGSQMLTPGGTPETSTPVGGQTAAPSYWNMGAQGYGAPSPSGGGPGGPTGILAIPQQWIAMHAGLGPGADEATAAALQRAAAYRAALLSS
jgi:hypothetical protein